MRTGWHGGGASYEGAALAVPMTRLQITPQREQGRTKRKPQQAPSTDTLIPREVNRLQIRTALSDGRRRRRRRRRNVDDDHQVVAVDDSCLEQRERKSGDSGAGGGLVAGILRIDSVDRYEVGGAFGAIREGVASGVTKKPGVSRDRDTWSGRSADRVLVAEAPDGDQQHAALPHGQEMEGLSLAGSRGRSTGGAKRSYGYAAGTHVPESYGDSTDIRLDGETSAQA